MIVLDTHAWLWWVSDPDELSEDARNAIHNAMADKKIYISSISVWEVALLAARGRLQFTIDAADWITRTEALPFLSFVPVNNNIAIKAVNLPGSFHRDPADRIIIATALIMGAAPDHSIL